MRSRDITRASATRIARQDLRYVANLEFRHVPRAAHLQIKRTFHALDLSNDQTDSGFTEEPGINVDKISAVEFVPKMAEEPQASCGKNWWCHRTRDPSQFPLNSVREPHNCQFLMMATNFGTPRPPSSTLASFSPTPNLGTVCAPPSF